MDTKIALIIGATGATGSELVKQLLEDNHYSQVHIFVRCKPDLEHQKLHTHAVDFDQLDTWKDKLKGDVLFSAMGTTLKIAGSKAAQYKIDYTYQHDVAQAAAHNRVPSLLLVSSVGSSSKSPFFYAKIKGQLEDTVSKLNFKQVCIFQPPFLDRGEFLRDNEKSGIKIMGLLNKLGILRSQRPMAVAFLAKQMIGVSNRMNNQRGMTYGVKDIWSLSKL